MPVPARMLVAVLLGLLAAAGRPARADTPPTIAVFDFSLVDTSPAPPTPEEKARLTALGAQLRDALARSGHYRPVDLAGLRERIAAEPELIHCNGCERDLARAAGADLACYGWVQKVSNLILNINLVIEDAATGKHLRVGSVDIRGNTDESWRRGLDFLLQDRILPP